MLQNAMAGRGVSLTGLFFCKMTGMVLGSPIDPRSARAAPTKRERGIPHTAMLDCWARVSRLGAGGPTAAPVEFERVTWGRDFGGDSKWFPERGWVVGRGRQNLESAETLDATLSNEG